MKAKFMNFRIKKKIKTNRYKKWLILKHKLSKGNNKQTKFSIVFKSN